MQPEPDPPADDKLRRLQSRLERERCARREAEQLLESKSREQYQANQALIRLASDLEQRVHERTSELNEERRRALRQAEIDPLTGLANRTSFARRLAEIRHQAPGASVATLLIDLDEFKAINDRHGHAAGDRVLVETAQRLCDATRPNDLVARLGGDEFAVVASAIDDPGIAEALSSRLLEALCRPIELDGKVMDSSCSIGVALSTPECAEALMSNADLALYEAKRMGRARVVWFEPRFRTALEERAARDNEVRTAVNAGHIQPWYQPIHRISNGRFVGAEVLARWHLCDGSVRPPAAFIESVESLSLLDAMMENMLRIALREAGAAIAGGQLKYLSINVSPNQFNQGWALMRLPGLLQECSFPTNALVVEITETAALLDFERTREMLAELKAAGMHIAIDDFGIDRSNFRLLAELPVDILKLDRSLINEMTTKDSVRAITECILQLAARLNLKVVAEGVETEDQACQLARYGCAAMQGYWYARPARQLSTWFPLPVTEPLCVESLL